MHTLQKSFVQRINVPLLFFTLKIYGTRMLIPSHNNSRANTTDCRPYTKYHATSISKLMPMMWMSFDGPSSICERCRRPSHGGAHQIPKRWSLRLRLLLLWISTWNCCDNITARYGGDSCRHGCRKRSRGSNFKQGTAGGGLWSTPMMVY